MKNIIKYLVVCLVAPTTLLFTYSAHAEIGDVVLTHTYICEECATPTAGSQAGGDLEIDRYIAFVLKECFAGTPGGFGFSSPNVPGLGPVNTYFPAGPPVQEECNVFIAYKQWASFVLFDYGSIFFQVCGEAGRNPGEDCVGFEVALDPNTISLPDFIDGGLDFGITVGYVGVRVTAVLPNSQTVSRYYTLQNDGKFPETNLPSTSTLAIPYNPQAIPMPGAYVPAINTSEPPPQAWVGPTLHAIGGFGTFGVGWGEWRIPGCNGWHDA